MKLTLITVFILTQLAIGSAQVIKIGGTVGMAKGINHLSIKNKNLANGLEIPSKYELLPDFPLVIGISISKVYPKAFVTINVRSSNTKYSNSFDNFIDTNIILAFTANEYSIATTELSLEVGKIYYIPRIANLYPFIGLSLNYNDYVSYTQRASISIRNTGIMGVGNNIQETFEPFLSLGGVWGISIQPFNKQLRRLELIAYMNYQFDGGIDVAQTSELINVFQNKSEVYKSTFSIRPIYYVLGLKYNFIWKELKKMRPFNN